MRTLAVMSAAMIVYCWKVALRFEKYPWKRLCPMLVSIFLCRDERYHVHFIADRETSHTFADLLHDTSSVGTKDSRVLCDEERVVVDLPVNRVETRRMDCDEELPRTGLGSGDVLDGVFALLFEEEESLVSRHC